MRSRSAHVPCMGNVGPPLPYRADDAPLTPRDDRHGHSEAHTSSEYADHSSAKSKFGSKSFFCLGFLRKIKWDRLLANQKAKEFAHEDVGVEALFIDAFLSSLKRKWHFQLSKWKGARSKRSASSLALVVLSIGIIIMMVIVLLVMCFSLSRTDNRPVLATTPSSSDNGNVVYNSGGVEGGAADDGDAIANDLMGLLAKESNSDRLRGEIFLLHNKKEKEEGDGDDDDDRVRGKETIVVRFEGGGRDRDHLIAPPLPPPPPRPAARVGAAREGQINGNEALGRKAERGPVVSKKGTGSGGRAENQKVKAENMGKKGGGWEKNTMTGGPKRRNNNLLDDDGNEIKELGKEKQAQEEEEKNGGRTLLPVLRHVDGKGEEEADGRGVRGALRVVSMGGEEVSSVPRSILENYVFGLSLLPIDKSTEEGRDTLRFLSVSPSAYGGEECGEGGIGERTGKRQGDNDDANTMGERPKDGKTIAEVIPRFVFDNVHTSPLALAISSGVYGLLPAAPQQSSASDEFIDKAFATNKILRLYKDIPPSRIDGAPAFSRKRKDTEDEKEGLDESERGKKINNNNHKNKATAAGAPPSAFFSLMDEGLYSLHPVRRIVEDYLEKEGEQDEKGKNNDGDNDPNAKGAKKKKSPMGMSTYRRYLHTNPPIRAGTAGGGDRGAFWSSRRPLLKELLMRYQTFHAEGIARLREKVSSASSRHPPEKETMRWRGVGSGLSDEDFSQFVVVQPVGQLCNRLVAIVSAFLFALMTRRVLLVDDGDFYCSLNDLFTTPGMAWIWSDDEKFLISSAAPLKRWSSGGHPFVHEEERRLLRQRARKDSFLLDFSKLGINDQFEGTSPLDGEMRVTRVSADGEQQHILNPKYGHVFSSSSSGTDRVHHHHQAAAMPPLSAIQRAFAAGSLREYVIANPESGTWQETEKLLCSDDYRATYKSKGSPPKVNHNHDGGPRGDEGGESAIEKMATKKEIIHHKIPVGPSPSVVTFTVNQYLVPYFYRNPFYHDALVEIFGLTRKRAEEAAPSAERAGVYAEKSFFHGARGFGEGGIFHPIAHFLFRPLPSLIRRRDDFIREHFFDNVNKNDEGVTNGAYVPSFVVGLQVRAGGDFTGNAMSREDWQLYRDCGLQASPPDTTLVAASPSSDKRRRFKFFVATDTAKGRLAAKTFLSQVPTQVHSSFFGTKHRNTLPVGRLSPSNVDIPVLFGPDFLLSNHPEGVRAALLDLLLLSASDDKVQTAWSSFGYFAAGISGVNGNLVTNRAPSFLVSLSSGDGSNHIESRGQVAESNAPPPHPLAREKKKLFSAADKGRGKAKAVVGVGVAVQNAEHGAIRKGVGVDNSSLKGGEKDTDSRSSRCLDSVRHHRLLTSRHHPLPLSELSILHLPTLARHKKGALKNEKLDKMKSFYSDAAPEKAPFQRVALRQHVVAVDNSKGSHDTGEPQSQGGAITANTIGRVVHVLQLDSGGRTKTDGGSEKVHFGRDEHESEGTNRNKILEHLQVAESSYPWFSGSLGSNAHNGVRQSTRGLRVHFADNFWIGVAGSEDFRVPPRENERPLEEDARKGGLSGMRRTDLYSQYRSIFFERVFTDRDRLGEQRYMGVMHKSDKRAQCVRLPTTEPCFHKFESWGASKTSCFDWNRMTFEEMIDGGRYC